MRASRVVLQINLVNAERAPRSWLRRMSVMTFITSRIVRRAMADDWHALRPEAVLQRLESSPLGLTTRDSATRLARVGPNELVQTTRISPLRILLTQFTAVLVLVHIIAAIISAALGLAKNETSDLYDAILIIAIVIMNAVLGFLQEYRAERSLEALKTLAAPRAHGVREGAVVAIPSRELVPGEVIVLAAGDRVPADARLLEAASLRVNEASLTGESLPVSKSVEPQPRDTFLGDRKNLVFMGTTVDGGRGKAVVVETAMATELGKIAGLVQQETKEETPLQKQLDRLGRQIGIAVLLAASLIFVIGVLRELPGLDASHVELLFLTAVGLSVAAIPEGLPAIVTISLALGLQRMIRRHALIRKLPAVEALGAASVICSDKTGTLTKGEMNVRAIVASDREYEVRGEGFDPTGDVRIGGQKADLAAHPDLRQLLECAVLCNDAALKNESGRWVVGGDRTEGALLVAATRGGLDPDSIRADMPGVAEVAFPSERKKMSTLHAELSEPDLRAILSVPEGERHTRLEGAGAYLFVKGAPERVLATCAYHVVEGVRKPLTEYDRKQYLFRNQEMATRALRVLGFAVREFPREVPPLREDALETDLTFLGLAGMMDAPRADAIAAIERGKRAGIHVVMITGDHKLTAMAVAREMGILGEGEGALTGEGLGRGSGDELVRKFVAFLLSANAGEVLVMFIATLALADPQFLPFFSPVQLLWINLVTDGLPALALGVDPYPTDLMARSPRNPKEGVLSRDILFLIVVVAVILTVGTLGIFFWELAGQADVIRARTVAFTTLVFFELFLVFAIRSPRQTLWSVGPLSTPKLIVAVLASLALPLPVA